MCLASLKSRADRWLKVILGGQNAPSQQADEFVVAMNFGFGSLEQHPTNLLFWSDEVAR